MLHSHSIEDEKFGLFMLFLDHVLEGNIKYQDPVNSVILETRALAKGEKDIYSIDRDTYSIVVYLNKQSNTFFNELPNTNSFEPKVYKQVRSLLNNQQILSFF